MNITLREGFDGKSGEQVKWERNCFMFGLHEKMFGKTFSFGGEIFTITGIRPKARKNPVLGTNVRGKVFVFPADVVRTFING